MTGALRIHARVLVRIGATAEGLSLVCRRRAGRILDEAVAWILRGQESGAYSLLEACAAPDLSIASTPGKFHLERGRDSDFGWCVGCGRVREGTLKCTFAL